MKTIRASVGLTGVALLAGMVPLAAQQPMVGIRSAVTYARLGAFNARPGYTTGPTVAFPLNTWVAVQAELLYTTFGGSFSGRPSLGGGFVDGAGFPVSSNYASFQFVQLPVVARLDLGSILGGPVRPTLYVGPQASYLLSCGAGHDAYTGERLPCGTVAPTGAGLGSQQFVGLRSFDVGGMAGVGVLANVFDFVQVATEVRYQRGFRAVDPMNPQLRFQTWSLAFRVSPLGLGRGRGQGYTDQVDDEFGGAAVSARRSQHGPLLKGAVQGVRM